MSFQLIKFQEKVRAANGHYEWFRTSSLHNLMALLRDYPARTRPDQIAAEIAGIPDDKKDVKYKAAFDYLRAEIPLNNMGISQGAILNAKQAMQHVTPNALPPPTLRPDVVQKVDASTAVSVQQKAKAFDKASRINRVLSGHGCWAQMADGTWPRVDLKKGQEIRFYCNHFEPLGNDVGQLIDNHQDVAAVETWVGPQRIFDYTLQEKGTLKLLNRMKGTGGKQLDARFITVDADTRLSSFINDPGNATAVFHWAACRVVFNRYGQMWDDNAGRWMTYNHTTHSWA